MKNLIIFFSVCALLLSACSSDRVYSHIHTLKPAPKVSEAQMVGRFYCGDGLGINHSLALNDDGTFCYQRYYCTGSDESANGECWFIRDGRQLVLKYAKDQDTEFVFTVARIDGKLSFYDPQWEAEIAEKGPSDLTVFRRLK